MHGSRASFGILTAILERCDVSVSVLVRQFGWHRSSSRCSVGPVDGVRIGFAEASQGGVPFSIRELDVRIARHFHLATFEPANPSKMGEVTMFARPFIRTSREFMQDWIASSGDFRSPSSINHTFPLRIL
jgi:hypothetical protein